MCSLFNMDCIGRQVTSSLSAHVTTTSETFYFKMADAVVVFYENQTSLHTGVQEKESIMRVRDG